MTDDKKKASKKTSKKTGKKTTQKKGKPTSSKSKLSQTKDLLVKALKGDDWKASLDPRSAKESQPHYPTGSIIIDHLIGGKPNKWGVPPCPGLPKGRILNLYGHEGSGKCLSADTLISTQKGLQTVTEIFAEQGLSCTAANWTKPVVVSLVNGQGELENTTHFTSNGSRPLTSLRTFSGGQIRTTANHPHLVMTDRGFWAWRKTKDIREGDVLISRRILPLGDQTLIPERGYLLGILLADGHRGSSRTSVANDDPSIKEFLENAAALAEDLPAPKQYANNEGLKVDDEIKAAQFLQLHREASINYRFNSKMAVEDLYNSIGWAQGVAKDKRFGATLRSLDQPSLRSVLQGYFDCESYVDPIKGEIEVVSASPQLLRELSLLLRGFGILSLVRDKKVAAYPDKVHRKLTISGQEARKFSEVIGTRSLRRSGEFEELRMNSESSRLEGTNFDSIPNCGGLLRDLYDACEPVHHLCADYMGVSPRAQLTYDRLGLILEAFKDQRDGVASDVYRRLEAIHQANYFYDEVVGIEECEPEPTFDFAMEKTHSFVAEGFVTHNTTIALTAAATTIANGGEVVYIDWEHEIVPEYALELGVPIGDEDKFMLCQPDTLDDGIAILWTAASAGVDLIVLDSVGAGVPKKFFEKSIAETADQGRIGMNAAVWSAFLPKLKARITKTGTAVIGISQIRSNINAMGYGEQTTVQGGKAWRFYSALRMKLQRIKTEKASDYSTLTNKSEDRVVGAVIQAKLEKCKVSPQQGNEETFYIRWGEGIDDLRSLIEIAKAHNIIRQSGAWLYWTSPDGEEHGKQGMEKFRAMFSADPKLQKVLEKQVRPYIAAKGGGSSSTADQDEGDSDEGFDESLAGEELSEILGKMNDLPDED